jgi:thiamine-phosphate pyrophosphorylase
MKPLNQCRLYTFVDLAYLDNRSPTEIATQLCDGGSDLIQLRAKNLSSDSVRQVADQILPIVERAGIGLVINDDLQTALDIGAPYCHLGQEDFFERDVTHISQILPPACQCQIGLSSLAPAQAQRAIAAGAAYLGVGPVFSTPTKPEAIPVKLDSVRWAAIHVRLPWFAIGGINLNNVEEVLGAGARRLCVISAILKSPDIAHTCQEFLRHLDAHE